MAKSVFSTVSNDPKKVEFFYNDRGHRVSKLTTLPNNTQQQTFYVGDASGSAMAIYNTSIGIGTEPSNNIEYPIYGLSRLGVADQGNIFKYQISDHLGNVRAVIQRDGSGTVVFHNDFNNTSTIPAGWVAGPNTALSIDTTHDRLKASVSNVSNNSLTRSFSVLAGHNYKINFKTDLDQTPNTLQYSINAIGGTGSGVYTTAVNGTYTFNYTAASNGTVTLLFKLLNSYGGISIQNNYFLDDVKVTDITTTNTPLMLVYKDYYPFGMPMPNRNPFGMPMPNRNQEGAYRYAYQGQEKDAETGMEAFELRLWDARIGRWLTMDPYGQYASPYLGMGNNPISRIDPDGGLDWHYDDNGNLVSDAGDNAQTLADFKGISFLAAQNIISAEGFFTDFNSGNGFESLMEGQVARGRQFGSPYRLGQNIKVSKYDIGMSELGSGWNSFNGRARGPASPIYGDFDITSRVSISNGQHYLRVSAGAYTPNDPRNKNGSSLNIKYELDKSLSGATNTYNLELLPLPLMPENYTYLGHKTILLPNNPNEITRLWIIASVHTMSTGAIPAKSANLKVDLLPVIQY